MKKKHFQIWCCYKFSGIEVGGKRLKHQVFRVVLFVWAGELLFCSVSVHNWYRQPLWSNLTAHHFGSDISQYLYPYGRLIGQPSTFFVVPLRSICSIKIVFFENTQVGFSKKVFSFCFSKSTSERGHSAPKIIKIGSGSSENEQIEV